MTATIHDVARAASVHISTVSRALNADTRHLVSARTAARVARIAAELGYEANPLARGLKTTRTSSIGLVVPDITSPLFAHMARGIEDVTMEAGYSVLIVDTDYSPDRELLQLDALRNRRVEGIITATGITDAKALDNLLSVGIQVIYLNRTPERPEISSVVADDPSGIEQAVDHLVRLGHTRIAHIAGPVATSTGLLRSRAFRSAMVERGLAAPDDYIFACDHFREPDGEAAMTRLLDSAPEVTAVVTADDRLALGCYQAVRSRGLRCPDDISIVGFNDLPVMEYLAPPLTTVAVSHYDMGTEVAGLLLRQLRGEGWRPATLMLPARLQVRGSTAPPRAT